MKTWKGKVKWVRTMPPVAVRRCCGRASVLRPYLDVLSVLQLGLVLPVLVL